MVWCGWMCGRMMQRISSGVFLNIRVSILKRNVWASWLARIMRGLNSGSATVPWPNARDGFAQRGNEEKESWRLVARLLRSGPALRLARRRRGCGGMRGSAAEADRQVGPTGFGVVGGGSGFAEFFHVVVNVGGRDVAPKGGFEGLEGVAFCRFYFSVFESGFEAAGSTPLPCPCGAGGIGLTG